MVRSVNVKITYCDELLGDVLDDKLKSLQEEGHTILGVHQVKRHLRVGFSVDDFVIVYSEGDKKEY